MKKNKKKLNEYFYEGAYPTDEQFHDVIESQLGVLDDVSNLSEPTAEDLGDEYKIGNTFYKCVLSSGRYEWQVTATAVPTNQYSDLEGKPTIGGVRIVGDIADVNTLGALSKTVANYSSLSSRDITDTNVVYIYNGASWFKTTLADLVEALGLATTVGLAAFKEEVLEEAETLVDAALDEKMDKDFSDLKTITYLSDEGYLPVVVDGELVKMTVMDMADYTEVKKEASKSSSGTSVASQRKYLALTGAQNGSNVNYTATDGFVMTTTALYFNGQLLTRGADYTEVSSYQITMLTHIPVSTDVLILMAVPLES